MFVSFKVIFLFLWFSLMRQRVKQFGVETGSCQVWFEFYGWYEWTTSSVIPHLSVSQLHLTSSPSLFSAHRTSPSLIWSNLIWSHFISSHFTIIPVPYFTSAPSHRASSHLSHLSYLTLLYLSLSRSLFPAHRLTSLHLASIFLYSSLLVPCHLISLIQPNPILSLPLLLCHHSRPSIVPSNCPSVRLSTKYVSYTVRKTM